MEQGKKQSVLETNSHSAQDCEPQTLVLPKNQKLCSEKHSLGGGTSNKTVLKSAGPGAKTLGKLFQWVTNFIAPGPAF